MWGGLLISRGHLDLSVMPCSLPSVLMVSSLQPSSLPVPLAAPKPLTPQIPAAAEAEVKDLQQLWCFAGAC